MDKDNDYDLEQLKANSSMDLIRKYKIKVENEKASKRRNGSNSNVGKNQHIGSTQQQPICLPQTIGIDEGRIQKGLSKSTNKTQSFNIGGVLIPVRGSTGSIEAQNKKQEQMKPSLNVKAATQEKKATQFSQQKDIAKSTSRAESTANEEVSMQVTRPKKMQEKMLDAMKPSLNNGDATSTIQSKLHLKRQLRSTVGGNQSQETMIDARNPSLNIRVATKNVQFELPMKRQLRSTTSGNQSQGTTIEEQSLRKKSTFQSVHQCQLVSLLKKNQQPHQAEELGEESDQEQAIEGDINNESEEVEEFNENTTKGDAR